MELNDITYKISITCTIILIFLVMSVVLLISWSTVLFRILDSIQGDVSAIALAADCCCSCVCNQ